MSGRLICFVGPSGVGKDTVMDAWAARRGALRARRVITRPGDAGGEDFEGVTPAEFARRSDAGDFALDWAAHGLRYGVPATIRADLARGQDVLVNLSRKLLPTAVARFPGAQIVHLTAPAEVLATRLAARGREDSTQILARLARADMSLPEGLDVITLDNSGPLTATLDALDAALAPTGATRDVR